MKIIDKIKTLLNKTVENGCTEEEAKAALLMARKLMIKYKLNENDIKDSNEDNIIKQELQYNCNVFWIHSLLKVFLNNFGIMHFMINKNEELHCVLFGIKVDVDCVRTLMNCAYDYVNMTSKKYSDEYTELFGIKDDTIETSFKMGFINGLEAKYEEQNKQLTNEEALMTIPNKDVQNEFDNFTKEFEELELDFTEQVNNNADFLAMEAGYNAGRIFGTTGISSHCESIN